MPNFELTDRKLFGYTLVAVDPKGAEVRLNTAVQSMTWSGELNQSAMSLDVTLMQVEDMHELVQCGDRLFLYVFQSDTGKTILLFTGMIVERQMTAGLNGTTRLVAHDLMFYLLKNRDDFVFRNRKASEILQGICTQFGLVAGEVADTGYVIPSLVCRNQTLYDTIVKALLVTRDATGKKFLLRADGRGINLLAKAKPDSMWILEQGRTLLSAEFSDSIADMRNQVKVISHAQNEDRSELLALAQDPVNMKHYGVLQEVSVAEASAKDASSAAATAKTLLQKLNKKSRKARIQSVAVHGLYPGDPIQVIEPDTGLSGVFYITSIRTNISASGATVDLDLAWEDGIAGSNTP